MLSGTAGYIATNRGCPARFGTIETYERRSFNVSSTLLFMCLSFVRLFICHGLLHALFFVVVSRTCMSLTVKRPWILRAYTLPDPIHLP